LKDVASISQMDCGATRLVHPYEYQTIGNSLTLPNELSQTNGNQFSFTRLLRR